MPLICAKDHSLERYLGTIAGGKKPRRTEAMPRLLLGVSLLPGDALSPPAGEAADAPCSPPPPDERRDELPPPPPDSEILLVVGVDIDDTSGRAPSKPLPAAWGRRSSDREKMWIVPLSDEQARNCEFGQKDL